MKRQGKKGLPEIVINTMWLAILNTNRIVLSCQNQSAVTVKDKDRNNWPRCIWGVGGSTSICQHHLLLNFLCWTEKLEGVESVWASDWRPKLTQSWLAGVNLGTWGPTSTLFLQNGHIFSHFSFICSIRFLPLTFSIRPGSRLLDGCVSDDTEATALTFNIRLIDVCVPPQGPWGPAGGEGRGRWMGRTGWQSRPQGSELVRQRLSSPFSNRWLSHGQQASRTVARAGRGKKCRLDCDQFQVIAHAGWLCAWCLESITQYIPPKNNVVIKSDSLEKE